MRPETLTRRVGAGLSLSTDAAEAAGEAAREARAALGGAPVDLAFLFLSGDHFGGSAEAVAAVEEELAPRHLLGCVAEGVVARDRELEDGPGVAVWADRKSTRLNSSHPSISYAVFCLKKKTKKVDSTY